MSSPYLGFSLNTNRRSCPNAAGIDKPAQIKSSTEPMKGPTLCLAPETGASRSQRDRHQRTGSNRLAKSDMETARSDRRPDTPKWLVLLVFAAIGHQLSHLYFFNSFAPDKVRQIVAAQSLLAGNGLSVPEIDLQDFAQVDYRPVVGWPPGYSLLIASILPFVRDVWWSALIVDVCATVLFFASWFYILEAMSRVITLEARVLVWGFWALFHSPLETLTSTDALSLAMLSGAMALTIHAIRDRSSGRWTLIAAGALAVGSAAVRFMYWPLAAAVPAGLLGPAFRDHTRLKRAGVTVAVLVVAGTLIVGASHRISTGHTTFLSNYYGPSDVGLHWRNLLRVGAFPAEALGVAGVWPHLGLRLKLQQLHPLLSTLLVPGLSLFVCGASLVSLIDIRAASHRRADTDALVQTYLWTTALVVSVLTVGTIFLLSLMFPINVSKVFQRDPYWTYVEELRYYAPVSLFMFISIACLVQKRNSVIRRALAAVGILAVLFGSSVAAREHTRNYSQRLQAFHMDEEAQFGAERATVMRVLRERSGTNRAVYLDSDLQLVLAAALVGSPIFHGDASQLAPVATEPVTAVVGVPRTDVDAVEWQGFLSRSHATFVAETSSRRLYELEVDIARVNHEAPVEVK